MIHVHVQNSVSNVSNFVKTDSIDLNMGYSMDIDTLAIHQTMVDPSISMVSMLQATHSVLVCPHTYSQYPKLVG